MALLSMLLGLLLQLWRVVFELCFRANLHFLQLRDFMERQLFAAELVTKLPLAVSPLIEPLLGSNDQHNGCAKAKVRWSPTKEHCENSSRCDEPNILTGDCIVRVPSW
jgi:hypothetical protein